MTAFLNFCFIAWCILPTLDAAKNVNYGNYPSFDSFYNDNNLDNRKPGPSFDVGKFFGTVGLTAGFGGGVFLGYKLVKQTFIMLRNKFQTTSIDANLFEDKKLSVNSIIDTSELLEMKKEQEELWRFLHSIFKTQEEMIAKLSKLPVETDSRNASTVSKEVVDKSIKDLDIVFQTRIKAVMNKLNEMEGRIKEVDERNASLIASKDESSTVADNSFATPEDVTKIVKTEIESFSELLTSMRGDIKSEMMKLLTEHDDTVVEKIRMFGDDVKLFVKNHTKANRRISIVDDDEYETEQQNRRKR